MSYSSHNSIIWQVCREYAGIAEAGGVKNVVCSLSEELVRCGFPVTVFIPFYGFISRDLFSFTEIPIQSSIQIGNTYYDVSFYEAFSHGVRFIFIDASLYREKQAVYTYTEGSLRGKGHSDAVQMNLVLQRALIAFSLKSNEIPDVLHCQDAHTALLPVFIEIDPFLKERFAQTRRIVTIHNAGAGYHQELRPLQTAYEMTGIPFNMLESSAINGAAEPFLLACETSAILTTVSPWYAQELCTPDNPYSAGLSTEFVKRHTTIIGITNGIDFDRYNPEYPEKSFLPFAFNAFTGDFDGKKKCTAYLENMLNVDGNEMLFNDSIRRFGFFEKRSQTVYFSYHGRIAHQKGLDILCRAAEQILDTIPESRFVIIGQGDPELEDLQIKLAQRFAGRYVFLCGYERSLVRLCVAASDFLVLPSRFEPCGLEDFIGQIFGTIPVAHAVGGLQKIEHGKTGFLYHSENNQDDSTEILVSLLLHVAKLKLSGDISLAAIQKAACALVRETYSWNNVIKKQYIPLYHLTKSE